MDIAGTPFAWLPLDAAGALTDPAARAGLAALLAPGITDLVVISHGWQTDQAGAWQLYEPLWTNVLAAWPAAAARPASGFAIAGVVWPSKPFRTDFDNPAPPEPGALALPPAAADDGDLSADAFEAVLADALALFGPGGAAVAAAARAAAGGIGPDKAETLLAALRAAAPARPGDPELAVDRAPVDPAADAQGVLLDLMAPPVMTVAPAVGGALDIGSVLQGVFAGPRAAIGRLLNVFTYYEMKARAGVVGTAVGGAILGDLAPAAPARLHLIGHSFGGRLVTAIAAAIAARPSLPLTTLALLQAAFSQNGLSASFDGGEAGAYPKVVGKVAGPLLATHTHNDSACTLAYALASRLVRDNSQAIGDAADPFGAIGANGLLNLAADALAADQTLTADGAYRFTPGKAHNILADACVASHMDVTNPAVARLVAAALAG